MAIELAGFGVALTATDHISADKSLSMACAIMKEAQ